MKGHQIFWIGCLSMIWLGLLKNFIFHECVKENCFDCIMLPTVTAVILIIDGILTLVSDVLEKQYKGIWWILYQLLKRFNSFLDKFLK